MNMLHYSSTTPSAHVQFSGHTHLCLLQCKPLCAYCRPATPAEFNMGHSARANATLPGPLFHLATLPLNFSHHLITSVLLASRLLLRARCSERAHSGRRAHQYAALCKPFFPSCLVTSQLITSVLATPRLECGFTAGQWFHGGRGAHQHAALPQLKSDFSQSSARCKQLRVPCRPAGSQWSRSASICCTN